MTVQGSGWHLYMLYTVDGANLFLGISINFSLIVMSKSELFDCD